MTAWTFLRDHIRLTACYVTGVLLALLVPVLTARSHGIAVSYGDVGYACLLALVMLTAYLLLEYSIRRRAYRLAHVLWHSLHSGHPCDLPTRGTREQRDWIRLLRQVQGTYLERIAEVEERRRFYEVCLTHFAHQMKTPLSVMRFLEEEFKAVLRQLPDPALGLALVDQLAEERDRLDAQLQLLLQTARLASFSFDVRIEPVDIAALIREAVNEHKQAWIRRALYPEMIAPDGPVTVPTDRKWLRFVCDQILRNALQYGVKPGATRPSPLRIEIASRPGCVTVSFTDQGIGIPARDLPHIFEPFFTGTNGRTYSRATGMGLYLVKHICDRLGHRVDVVSKENEGTTFTLTLAASKFYAAATEP
ncbi:sensor histidine kinase YvcQ [Alicyclobacillus cellulosilyticus]|uniref:histidine kinase n=1 Tax=Alicyclobacillus cellulosilyticus TaxID=1003997 RepID=A0A917K3Q1_9BACL|nr:sensor histidine kinase [Alicyclobacillus cellulosilyticus]GGI96608.1 sensor histidine kinase YvcQ [Alicyclobacillus cellulosilyticus]